MILGAAKIYVFYLEKHAQSLAIVLKSEQKEVNLLKIEWTYLNQSQRLEKLAATHLQSWQQLKLAQLKPLPFKEFSNANA